MQLPCAGVILLLPENLTGYFCELTAPGEAVGNNAAGGSPEYAVIDSPAATDQTRFYSNVETLPNSDCNYAEIQPHCQGSEEVSYAMVTISTPDQQPTYANVEQWPKKTRPAKPPEETLFSAVKKPPKH
ncbi:unnamed protein product [Natator depressus]